MKNTMQNNLIGSLKLLALVSLAVGVLSGFTSCSSGSGSDNNVNAPTNSGGSSGLTYSGPPPLFSDVQEFKINLWDNLVDDSRCGSCHKQGGTGSTSFVRDDNINTAYQAALTVVDLDSPSNSLLVQRMNQGHNCWDSSTAVCASLMEQWIQRWADATTAAATVVNIQAVPYAAPGSSLNFPADSTDFDTLIYTPILRPYCGRCHSEDGSQRQQQPYFASANVDTAYSAAQSKIDLNNTANSRFVYRLAVASHNNCWDPADMGGPTDCAANAVEMKNALDAYVASLGAPDVVDTTALRVSGAVSFPANPSQGQTANSAGRFETNVIAKYEFKQLDQADPDRVVDTSGVSPQLDLVRSGDARFVSSWGMEFFGPTGRAQGRTSDSAKLYDMMTVTGEFAIEAWVIPANVTQDNVRRIVSYSGGATERNFTLGQTQYNYDTLLRTDSAQSDANGAPQYSTPDADEVLQASLQHVVINYDPINGRAVYVNGEQIALPADDLAGSNISNWNNAFVLVLGNETGAPNLDWKGTLRFVALHNRILTPEQIQANFSVGVGQKYYIPFNISSLVNLTDAYIVFEVERFDDYSYLFNEPFFTVLDPNAVLPGDIQIQGMRIGINGREAATGQAYANMDVTITNTDFQAAENKWLHLSSLGIPVAGTIISSEKILPETDEFFLSFDRIASQTSSVNRSTPDYPNVGLPVYSYQQSDVGLKHFYEINEMYSSLTGVPKDTALVASAFTQLKTQLPTSEDPVGFATSNQMGIAQFAAAYCEALASNATYRTAMWPSVNFTSRLDAQRTVLLDPLLEKLAAHRIAGSGLATQADPADVEADIDTLLGTLTTAQSGSLANGQATAIAVCTAVFGSAIATVQ